MSDAELGTRLLRSTQKGGKKVKKGLRRKESEIKFRSHFRDT